MEMIGLVIPQAVSHYSRALSYIGQYRAERDLALADATEKAGLGSGQKVARLFGTSAAEYVTRER